MLDHQNMVWQSIRGLQLRQRILVELEFTACLPRARQLQLIKDAEFMTSPRPVCCFAQCILQRAGQRRNSA